MKKLLLFLSFVSVAAAQQIAAWPQTVFDEYSSINFGGNEYEIS